MALQHMSRFCSRGVQGHFSSYFRCVPSLQTVRHLKIEDSDEEKYKKVVHPETPQSPKEYDLKSAKGKIYDIKPIKLNLTEGKKYRWCVCGTSKNQPFCDGSHMKLRVRAIWKKDQPTFSPLKFTVEKTKDYLLCTCKQTNKQPFCDGTHKREDIQAAVRS